MMNEFFAYEALTWLDIDALPRNTPLVIPLGDGYPLERLLGALGEPDRVGLLPPVPYGWVGSGLQVPDHLLGQMLMNLLDSLRDDGFTRVYALTPQGIELGLKANRVTLPHISQLVPLTPLPAWEEQGKVILIPIGHTEQHGYHLPLSTDTLIIDAIAQATVESRPDLAATLPVFPYGVSTHRSSFAGTLNAKGRAFEDFWLGVIDALVLRGFDCMYLLSGHGGNYSFLVNVVKYAGERHRRIFCATCWLHTSGPLGMTELQKHRRSKPGGMGHAGELETAMMLHLRPDLVRMDRVVDETNFISTANYTMDWIDEGVLVANPPWDDDTCTGAYGEGSVATSANGKIWLETAVAEKVAHVGEIHEQHARRQARRNSGFGLWGNQAVDVPGGDMV